MLQERRRQLAGSLSGGQQQMLAIARALMSSPRLLVVDEPSVGLAPILVSHTITKIKELKERYGLTVLMAEQNFHQAIRIADRGYIIVHGEIVFEGKTVAELEQNELVKNYYLGSACLDRWLSVTLCPKVPDAFRVPGTCRRSYDVSVIRQALAFAYQSLSAQCPRAVSLAGDGALPGSVLVRP